MVDAPLMTWADDLGMHVTTRRWMSGVFDADDVRQERALALLLGRRASLAQIRCDLMRRTNRVVRGRATGGRLRDPRRPDPEPCIGCHVTGLMDRDAVAHCLAAMSDRANDYVRRRYLLGYRVSEIARAEHLSPSRISQVIRAGLDAARRTPCQPTD